MPKTIVMKVLEVIVAMGSKRAARRLFMPFLLPARVLAVSCLSAARIEVHTKLHLSCEAYESGSGNTS